MMRLLLVAAALLPPSRPQQPQHLYHDEELLAQLVDDQLEAASALEQQARRLAASAAESGAARQLQLEAESAYRAAVAINPADPTPYYHLVHALRARGPSTSAESVAHFERAWRLDPDNVAAASSLGYLLIAMAGEDDGATEAAAAAQRRRGLEVLAHGVQRGLWPRSDGVWQHPMEWLPVVPPPPPSELVQSRDPYDCLLRHAERDAAAMGAEAVRLLPRFMVQTEGLSRPHGGWRDYELWRRCGLGGSRPGQGGQQLPPPPPGAADSLTATCAMLRSMSAAAPGALVHSASFSAISPGTVLLPHCGPNNGRFVMHVGLRVREDDGAKLRLGRPSSLTESAEALRALGLPGQEAEERAWRVGEGFVWDDSTCHEVVWRNERGSNGTATGSGHDDIAGSSSERSQQQPEPATAAADVVGVAEVETTTGMDIDGVESGEAFAAKQPRIILLLLFFHPTLTRTPVCADADAHAAHREL